jgi:hypothetical protein
MLEQSALRERFLGRKLAHEFPGGGSLWDLARIKVIQSAEGFTGVGSRANGATTNGLSCRKLRHSMHP